MKNSKENKQLEKTNLIRGYTIVVDARKQGLQKFI
jgi:hypothetical protein